MKNTVYAKQTFCFYVKKEWLPEIKDLTFLTTNH